MNLTERMKKYAELARLSQAEKMQHSFDTSDYATLPKQWPKDFAVELYIDLQATLRVLEVAREKLEDISGTHGDSWQEIGCDKNEAISMAASSMRANAKTALKTINELLGET